MRGTKPLILLTIIILFSLMLFTFADSTAKAAQAVESDARIIYNGREAVPGVKPYSIEGYNYLSVRSIAELFGKSIDWNQAEKKIIISDPPNYELNRLKDELAAKDKSIAELQDKVKKLENDLANSKKLDISELQEKINSEYSEYEDVSYKVILSGNEEEIRVKIEVDLSWYGSAWGKLSTSKKQELIKEICSVIRGEYSYAMIKGYVKDIAVSRKIMTFYITGEGEPKIAAYKNYSTIGALEDKINNEYDDYFHGINFTFGLKGNENMVEYTAYIQRGRFEEKWDKTSDSALKVLMRKVCSDIENEFKGCHIYGYVHDMDSSSELAYCEQDSKGVFIFERHD